MVKWETPPATGKVDISFPSFERRFGPYVATLGNLTVEFEDENCDRINDMWLEIAGRKLHVHVTPCGIGPIEVVVHLKGDECPVYTELYSKRPDGVFCCSRVVKE